MIREYVRKLVVEVLVSKEFEHYRSTLAQYEESTYRLRNSRRQAVADYRKIKKIRKELSGKIQNFNKKALPEHQVLLKAVVDAETRARHIQQRVASRIAKVEQEKPKRPSKIDHHKG